MDWPWQYSFPPFFTIQVSILLILTHAHDPWQWLIPQPHSATRAKQLEAWRHLVLNYCQVQNRVCWSISLSKVGQIIFCRCTPSLSWIWQMLETCLSSTMPKYQGDYLQKQYSQSLKILHNSEWILLLDFAQNVFFQWEPGMDGQEQTQRSYILEVSGSAGTRDIQVSLKAYSIKICSLKIYPQVGFWFRSEGRSGHTGRAWGGGRNKFMAWS